MDMAINSKCDHFSADAWQEKTRSTGWFDRLFAEFPYPEIHPHDNRVLEFIPLPEKTPRRG
jgi:hypothetical protein